MPLTVGAAAPAFTLTDTNGKTLTLESLKGKKVYLVLFRVAACPLCNLQTSRIKKQAAELKSAGLELVLVFESTMKEMKSYSGTQASADFNIYIDENKMAIYKDYQRVRSCPGSVLGRASCYHMCYDCKMFPAMPFVCKGCPPAVLSPMMMTPRGMLGMPVDVLIDEQGMISDINYGKVIGDHMPMDKVRAFAGLSGGAPLDAAMER